METERKTSDFQAFLDQNQYSEKGILRYEKIFGETFVSTGGRSTTEDFCRLLPLRENTRILDVGCGSGGSALFMVKEYGLKVTGVDLSENMIALASKRLSSLPPDLQAKVSFSVSDVTTTDFPDRFDVIYCRDVILHIKEKDQLFERFYKWLNPGGSLLISDYCRGDQDHGDDFIEYVRQRAYHLITVKEYGALLREAGFHQVQPLDKTPLLVHILHKELDNFRPQHPQFIKDFSQEDYDYLVDGWTSKIKRCAAGDQTWGLFLATKPENTSE